MGVALFILLAVLIDLEMEGITGGRTLPALIWLTPLAGMALLLGLTGIYLDLKASKNILIGITYLLAFSGTFTSTLVLFFGLASQASSGVNATLVGSHLSGTPPPAFVTSFFLLSGLLFIVGWPLFGISCLRCGHSPRWACWLLILGMPLGFPLRLPVPGGRALGVLIWGIGLVTIGWQVWRERP